MVGYVVASNVILTSFFYPREGCQFVPPNSKLADLLGPDNLELAFCGKTVKNLNFNEFLFINLLCNKR
jgi:hypothetical protein